MEISVYQDQVLFPRVKYLYFSQPVTLAIDGKLIIFDQIVDGEPFLSHRADWTVQVSSGD